MTAVWPYTVGPAATVQDDRRTFTTPAPLYVDPPPPVKLDEQLPALAHLDKVRIRAAAARAKKLYPPAVAALVYDALEAAAEFGYRMADTSKVARAVEEIMNTEDA